MKIKTHVSGSRKWELLTGNEPGYRYITCSVNGARRETVATIRMFRLRATFDARRGNYNTPREWRLIDSNGSTTGPYKSPQAAFDAFIKCL